jgi:hypothetical protein
MLWGCRFKASRNGLLMAIIASLLYLHGISSAATALTSQFSWLPLGPDPAVVNESPNFSTWIPSSVTLNASGRVTAIALDSNQSGRLFVGTANGGMWQSTDGGATFANIGSALPQTSAIGAIAPDETTGGYPNLYVGTGEDNHDIVCDYGKGIFRSTNEKQSWSQIGSQFVKNSSASSLSNTRPTRASTICMRRSATDFR